MFYRIRDESRHHETSSWETNCIAFSLAFWFWCVLFINRKYCQNGTKIKKHKSEESKCDAVGPTELTFFISISVKRIISAISGWKALGIYFMVNKTEQKLKWTDEIRVLVFHIICKMAARDHVARRWTVLLIWSAFKSHNRTIELIVWILLWHARCAAVANKKMKYI